MGEDNISQKFVKEIKNYFIKEIDQNELISKKHKKFCRVLNCIEHLLILVPAFTGCV